MHDEKLVDVAVFQPRQQMGKKRAGHNRQEPPKTDGSAESPPRKTRRKATSGDTAPKHERSSHHRKIIKISPLANLSAHAHLVTRIYPEQTPPAHPVDDAVEHLWVARPGLPTEAATEAASVPISEELSTGVATAGWATNWECTVVPVLTGLAMVLQLRGWHAIFAAHMDFLPTTSVMVTVLALLMASIGAGLPERAMLLVQKLIRQRPESSAGHAIGGRLNPLWLLGLTRQSDPELTWISLAVLGSAGGVLALLSLVASGFIFQMHHWLLTRFFWTSLSMAGMEWAICGVITMTPWIACGLTMVMLSCVTDVHYSQPRRAGQLVVTGVLAGIGIGWLLHGPFMAWGMSAEREVMIGSLPLFVIAVIGARASQRAETVKPAADVAGSASPELAAGGEVLAGLALIVWTVGVASAWTGWLECQDTWQSRSWHTPADLGVLLTGVSLAGVAAARFGLQSSTNAAGYGVAMWLCGIGAGSAASLAVWWPEYALSWVLQVCLLVLPTGYGVRQVAGYWLARASNGTLGFAHLLITLLSGSAIGLAASRWWGLPNLGSMGTLAAGSLALLAAGGLLEIHEEHQPSWTKRLKLALVFASLAAAIVLFPSNTRQWTRRERESASAALAKAQPSSQLTLALQDFRSACMIGIDPRCLGGTLPPLLSRADILPLVPSLQRRNVTNMPERARSVNVSASRWLRLHRTRYQFIYQLGRPLADGRGMEYTIEWLSTLAGHLTDGGRLMLEVPLKGLSRQDITVLAATFELASTSSITWRLTESAEPRLIFQAGRALSEWQAESVRDWCKIDRLFEAAAGPPIHSIRRPRIHGGSKGDTVSLVRWLKSLSAAEQ